VWRSTARWLSGPIGGPAIWIVNQIFYKKQLFNSSPTSAGDLADRAILVTMARKDTAGRRSQDFVRHVKRQDREASAPRV